MGDSDYMDVAAVAVDPASVQVGSIVKIEAYDGSWMVRGEVASKGTEGLLIETAGLSAEAATEDATVYVLHPAEPELDEAAVEALREAMVSTSEIVTDPESGDYSVTDWARELVKLGWGQVSDG